MVYTLYRPCYSLMALRLFRHGYFLNIKASDKASRSSYDKKCQIAGLLYWICGLQWAAVNMREVVAGWWTGECCGSDFPRFWKRDNKHPRCCILVSEPSDPWWLLLMTFHVIDANYREIRDKLFEEEEKNFLECWLYSATKKWHFEFDLLKRLPSVLMVIRHNVYNMYCVHACGK